MDAIAYHRAGYKNVVAIMGVNNLSNNLNSEQISMINSLDKKDIILSFDNDKAGLDANIQNGLNLLDMNFNVYVTDSYDENIKDVDELLNKKGKESVDNIVENKLDYISFIIKSKFKETKGIYHKVELAKQIISIMIETSDYLLKTIHLKMLSEISGLEYDDVVKYYKDIFSKIHSIEKTSPIKNNINHLSTTNSPSPQTNIKSPITNIKNNLRDLITFLETDSSLIEPTKLEFNWQHFKNILNKEFLNEIIIITHLCFMLLDPSELEKSIIKKYGEENTKKTIEIIEQTNQTHYSKSQIKAIPEKVEDIYKNISQGLKKIAKKGHPEVLEVITQERQN